jgi:hypothetical protein
MRLIQFLLNRALAGPLVGEGGFVRPPANLPTDIGQLLDNITGFLQTISVPIAAILYLWAAFLYLTAGGNEKTVKKANAAILYTTIGLAVMLVAKGLALVVKSFFTTGQ